MRMGWGSIIDSIHHQKISAAPTDILRLYVPLKHPTLLDAIRCWFGPRPNFSRRIPGFCIAKLDNLASASSTPSVLRDRVEEVKVDADERLGCCSSLRSLSGHVIWYRNLNLWAVEEGAKVPSW